MYDFIMEKISFGKRPGISPGKTLFSLLFFFIAISTFADAYEEPKSLNGTIYGTDSGTNKVLFSFKRKSYVEDEKAGIVRVIRSYLNPDGSVAAVETVIYNHGKLASFSLSQNQTGAYGSAVVVAAGSKNPAAKKINFEWTAGDAGKSKTKSSSETLQNDTLVGDMIPYFMTSHWPQLVRGEAVEFRFIVPDRLETVGFRLVKDSDTIWNGKPVLRVRMEASNFIVARLVDPLFFMVEKEPPHRIFEYLGRTTPKMREGGKWKDLDARSVFDF